MSFGLTKLIKLLLSLLLAFLQLQSERKSFYKVDKVWWVFFRQNMKCDEKKKLIDLEVDYNLNS